jgi:hypothetical protein
MPSLPSLLSRPFVSNKLWREDANGGIPCPPVTVPIGEETGHQRDSYGRPKEKNSLGKGEQGDQGGHFRSRVAFCSRKRSEERLPSWLLLLMYVQ